MGILNRGTAVGAGLLALLVIWVFLQGGSGPSEGTPVPAEFQPGEAKFHANCARCHGPRGSGSDKGPPLVHKIYEPSHHGDLAFQLAAANGVRAHHWNFGNMPRIEGVTSEDVRQITQYIRWLQRQAGIH